MQNRQNVYIWLILLHAIILLSHNGDTKIKIKRKHFWQNITSILKDIRIRLQSEDIQFYDQSSRQAIKRANRDS